MLVLCFMILLEIWKYLPSSVHLGGFAQCLKMSSIRWISSRNSELVMNSPFPISAHWLPCPVKTMVTLRRDNFPGVLTILEVSNSLSPDITIYALCGNRSRRRASVYATSRMAEGCCETYSWNSSICVFREFWVLADKIRSSGLLAVCAKPLDSSVSGNDSRMTFSDVSACNIRRQEKKCSHVRWNLQYRKSSH